MRDLQLRLVPLADGTRITITDRLTRSVPRVGEWQHTYSDTLSLTDRSVVCSTTP